MKFTLVNSTAVFIFATMSMTSCSSEDSSNVNVNSSSSTSNKTSNQREENAQAAKDDIDELEKIVKLPLAPDEVNYWEETILKTKDNNRNPAQTGKKIVAVLKFSPDAAAQLIGQIETIRPPADSEIDAEDRFPAELVAQSQLSGDETLKGKSYAADNFFQSPYNSGKITRVENSDYFVLELTAP